MATVASLVFEMSANIARLQSDMSKAKQTVDTAMDGINKAVSVAKTALGALGVATSAVGFVNMVKGSIESMGALHDLAEQTGQTVEMLSALRSVAKQSGTDMEQVAVGLQKLSRNMVEANSGLGKSGAMFRALGVDVVDSNGRLRDGGEVMKEVAEKLSHMENRTQAVAAAQFLLGKSGAQLLPFLNELAETGQLNARVTTEQAAAADKFEKQMARLAGQANATKTALANELLPSLNRLTGALLDAKSAGDKFGTIFAFLGLSNTDAANAGTNLNKLRKSLDEMKAMRDELSKPTAANRINDVVFGDVKDLDIQIAATEKRIDALKRVQRDAALAWAQGLGYTGDGRDARFKPKTTDFDLPGREAKGVASAAEKNPWYDPAKATAAREKYLQEVEDAATRAYENERAAAAATAQSEADLFAKAAMARLKHEEQVTEEADRLWKRQQEEAAKAAQRTDDITRQLGMTFSSAFEAAMVKGKGLREVLQGIEQDIAAIIIRQSITTPAAEAISSAVKGSGIADMFRGFFGGARAGGGPVSAGSAYLVGENGPEIFAPGSSGSIVPNNKIGGDTHVLHMTLNVGSLDPRGAAQVIMANMPVIADGMRRVYNSRGFATPIG